MSMDRTLKTRGGLMGDRSVLTRAERIERLLEEDNFDAENGSPLGLPKVKIRHSRAGKKAKKEAAPEEAAEGAEGAAGAATAEE